MKTVPETVPEKDRELYEQINVARAALKTITESIGELRAKAIESKNGEAIANVTLAYRHAEDSSMRLGKGLQALDGGVSVYDKATVPDVREVGTPRVGRGIGG